MDVGVRRVVASEVLFAERREVLQSDLERGRSRRADLSVVDETLKNEGSITALVDLGVDGSSIETLTFDDEGSRSVVCINQLCVRVLTVCATLRLRGRVGFVVDIEAGTIERDVRRCDVEDDTRENCVVETVLRVRVRSSRELELTDRRDTCRHVRAVGVWVRVRDGDDLREHGLVAVADDTGVRGGRSRTNEDLTFAGRITVVRDQVVAGLVTAGADCSGTRGVVGYGCTVNEELDEASRLDGASYVILHARADNDIDIRTFRNDELSRLHVGTECLHFVVERSVDRVDGVP